MFNRQILGDYLAAVGRRLWLATVAVLGVGSLAAFLSGHPSVAGWVALGILIGLAATYSAYAGERRKRLGAERLHGAPGELSTIPWAPSVDYQVAVLRQLIPWIAEAGVELDLEVLDSALERVTRTDMDMHYEPLQRGFLLREGCKRLADEGELETIKGGWRIVKKP